MEFIVIYTDKDGKDIATNPLREARKNDLVNKLEAENIEYVIKECPDTLYHCPRVVFDLQKIDEARKAVKENKELPGILYTCGDAEKIAKKNNVVTIKCSNGKKNAYVIDIWKATFDQVIAYKKKIGYRHLAPVIGKV